MGIEDIISSAASTGMPQQGQQSPMMSIGQAPLQMPQPMPRFQPPPQQAPHQGSFATVGERKRADKQELFHSIASLVKSGSDYIQAKKNRALQSNIERLMNAQQGLSEAQQILQQNPNDPKAREAVDTNNGIINDIRHDPKVSKQLQKAFNIDLFGEGKNKEENKALIAAWKAFDEKSKTDKTAQNPIARMMPQRQQMDPRAQQQAMAIKLGMSPDANAKLQALSQEANRIATAKTAHDQMQNDLKIAEMAAGKIGGEGVNVVDSDPSSLTGIQKLQMSADGKNVRRTQNVVLPSILPSEHSGISTLVVADPNSPTGQSIARIPNPSSTHKSIPGVGTVGAGGMVQRTGQGGQVNISKPGESQVPGHTTEGTSKAKSLGLPPGSTVISAKMLSPAQVAKYKDGITAIEGTVERLKDIRQYTDIYQNMMKAGKIKLVTSPNGTSRMLGGFVPSTEDEKKAAAAWQESAEYMNTFRQALSAQGFRSIPAYDNMLALRGQLWQDKTILNKTLDDSISFLNKELETKRKLVDDTTKDTTNAPTNPY